MQDRLYGWLKKKSSGGAWNKRYFFVDETRGTLGYAKSHKGRGAKPSAVLPIADITRIEAVRGSDIAAFTIVCPPIHLTVAAVNPKERKGGCGSWRCVETYGSSGSARRCPSPT